VKITEARAKAEMLIVQHRRSRAARRTAEVHHAPNGEHRTFERMRSKVALEESLSRANGELADSDVEGRLDALEREQQIDSLLKELKARRGASG
jgi:phage shock protein A